MLWRSTSTTMKNITRCNNIPGGSVKAREIADSIRTGTVRVYQYPVLSLLAIGYCLLACLLAYAGCSNKDNDNDDSSSSSSKTPDKVPLTESSTSTSTNTALTAASASSPVNSNTNTTMMHNHQHSTRSNNGRGGGGPNKGKGGGQGGGGGRRGRISRTVWLRTLLVVCLLSAVGICASLSYLKLRDTEENIGIQNYRSIRESTLIGAKEICTRKLQGADLLATLWSHLLPDASDWPLITMDGYIPVAQKLAALTSSTTYSTMLLLDPSQAPAYEAHIQTVYAAQGRPATAGTSDFGFGIWKRDPSDNSPFEDGRVHDQTGITTAWDGPRSGQLMVPLALHNQADAESLNLNLYAIEDRGVHIDSMFDCVAAHTNFSQVPSCSVTTDMLELVVRPGPAGLIFHPIFPANDPSNFVGFATTSLHWEEVLTNVVPNYVSGLTCVISTPTQTSTYVIRDGLPQWQGYGDFHDPKFNDLAESIVLNDATTTTTTTGAKSSATYTLTVYPADEMLDNFNTSAPRSVALGFLGAIMGCTLVFLLYDFLMRQENQERVMILEMKRRFVRFISHEIRTPLNTVCMGLELLQGELKTISKANNKEKKKKNVAAAAAAAAAALGNSSISSIITTQGEETTYTPEMDGIGKKLLKGNDHESHNPTSSTDEFDLWKTVVDDIHENAYVAVAILNDLLNYDKLETGTMKMETEPVFIWDLLERTVGQFRIQAVNAKVDLKLHMTPPHPKLLLHSPNTSRKKRNSHNNTSKNVQVASSLQEGDKEDQHDDGDLDLESAPSDSITPPHDCIRHLWSMLGDDVRVAQVLRNVISNALKFTPAEGCIEVVATYVPDGLPHAKTMTLEDGHTPCTQPRAGSIQIVIQDNGVGMSPDQLQMLFSEGVQFDANRLQHGGGSGLGLSIAKGIVEQHQGTVSVTSDGVGMGTSFIIEFPLHLFSHADLDGRIPMAPGAAGADGDPLRDPTARTESESTISYEDNKSRRVLVAEDAVSSRKMLIRLLERAGHVAIPAANGLDALEAIKLDLQEARNNPNHVMIDTTLMDYEMPVLKGPDATKQIRELGYNGIILGITGNVLEEDVEYFKEQGANEVLSKPIRMDRINGYWQMHDSSSS